MKVKIADLAALQPALTTLINTKLPVKASYRIGKGMGKVRSALNAQEDYRINTLNKIAKLDTADNKYKFAGPEDEAKFQAIMAEYNGQEIELDFQPVTLEDLGDAKIEPAVFMALGMLDIVVEIAVVKMPADGGEKKD